MDHYGNPVEIKKKREKIRGERQFRATGKEVAIWF